MLCVSLDELLNANCLHVDYSNRRRLSCYIVLCCRISLWMQMARALLSFVSGSFDC